MRASPSSSCAFSRIAVGEDFCMLVGLGIVVFFYSMFSSVSSSGKCRSYLLSSSLSNFWLYLSNSCSSCSSLNVCPRVKGSRVFVL